MDLPWSMLAVVASISAALILVYKEESPSGVHLGCDHHNQSQWPWYRVSVGLKDTGWLVFLRARKLAG